MDLAYHGAQTDLHSQTILPEGLEGKRLKVSHQQNLPFEGLPACEGHHRIAILWIGSIPFSALTNLNCTKMEVVKCAIRVRKSYLQDKPDANLYILSAQLDCNLNFQMLFCEHVTANSSRFLPKTPFRGPRNSCRVQLPSRGAWGFPYAFKSIVVGFEGNRWG